jgi:hypothetical protein
MYVCMYVCVYVCMYMCMMSHTYMVQYVHVQATHLTLYACIERVLFIGTQFSILYTSMYSPAEAATLLHMIYLTICARASDTLTIYTCICV